MKKIMIATIFVMLSTASFYSFKSVESAKPFVEGIWVSKSYEDGLQVYKRSEVFDSDKPGFELRKDGTMIKRQNIGWCGTPPISYGNYEGKWAWMDENTIRMEYKYWGGVDTIGFQIESLDHQFLKTKWVRLKK